jgi:hypothetical protein
MRKLTLLLASLALASCSAGAPSPSASDWAVSGFSSENPGERIWVVMRGEKIVDVLKAAPKIKKILETNATIFPGFIDLDRRSVASPAPLWPNAKRQFAHRFEWLKDESYLASELKGAWLFEKAAPCAALRWDELKSLTAGVTVMGGIAPKGCESPFGISHAGNPEEFNGESAHSLDFPLYPSLLRTIFVPEIHPAMREGKTYEEAYSAFLAKEKIDGWIERFRTRPHSIGEGLRLLVGKDFGLAPNYLTEYDFEKLNPKIRAVLANPPFVLKKEAVDEQIESMHTWLFGTADSVGYLKSARGDEAALDFLRRDPVLVINADARRYAGVFEARVRKPEVENLLARRSRVVMAELASGRRADSMASKEYDFASALGYTVPGFVIRGGAALNEAALLQAAKNDLSLVWHPFSDLLLYGETLDIETAKKLGLTIGLGSVGGTVGSKNLLDELGAARAYLEAKRIKSITMKQLLAMVTSDAARAIRMDGAIGSLKPGFTANLTLLNCGKIRRGSECAARSSQKSVALVVTKGAARYGDAKILDNYAAWSQAKPEPVAVCGQKKAILSSLPLYSVAQELGALTTKNAAPAPDSLFSCADAAYTEQRNRALGQLWSSPPPRPSNWSAFRLSAKAEEEIIPLPPKP